MSEVSQSVVRGNRAAKVLLFIGCWAMVGDALGLEWLRGLGVATVASPLPKVFSDVEGHETFAADFQLETREDGELATQPITPALYSRLAGPYNRRNVYGAALSYAPRMKEEVWQSVFCYAFEEDGPLRREFGIGPEVDRVRVIIETRTRGRDGRWELDPPCAG